MSNTTRQVAYIEGDGIGPEITEAVFFILEKANAKIEWQRVIAGQEAVDAGDDPLPQATVDAIRRAGVGLKGPLMTPIAHGGKSAKSFRSVNVALRKSLDLYANVRPVRSLPNVCARFENVDLVFIRENTEGLYSGLEQEVVPGVVTSLKVSTRVACRRIADYAFRYAELHGRKKVTGVHKANIMKLSDGLAIECYRAIAEEHPSISYDEKIIDATAMALVMDPSVFDVLVMENLYGDILSDLGAGLIGGLGLAPSANIGDNMAVFEAVHGTAPDIAGQQKANPTALLLSACQLLTHIGQDSVAKQIETAVFETFREKQLLTPDLGGRGTTMSFAREVVARLGVGA